MAGKYDRELVVMLKPARRNRSIVAFSRLPLGMPSLSFICFRRIQLWDRRWAFPIPRSSRFHRFCRSSFHSRYGRRRGRAIRPGSGANRRRNRFRWRGLSGHGRSFPFIQSLFACAAEEGDVAAFERPGPGEFAHEADHEDAAGFTVLYDGGNEAVEFSEIEFHVCFFYLQRARIYSTSAGAKKARRFERRASFRYVTKSKIRKAPVA